jgi:hypothetical protein
VRQVRQETEKWFQRQSFLLFNVLYQQVEYRIGMVNELGQILGERADFVQETCECPCQV